MSYAKNLEDRVTDNSTSQKANAAVSDYMQPYSPSGEYFDDAADLSSSMAHWETDVNMIQDVLQCSKTLKQGKPFLQQELVDCQGNLFGRGYKSKSQYGLQ